MRNIITVILISFSLVLLAQQDPYYSHFKFNPQAYNPGAAGQHEGEICLNGVSHYQWRSYDDVTLERGTNGAPGTAIENVAPVTQNLNVHGQIAFAEQKHVIGLGLSFLNDVVGFTQTAGASLSINYKIQLEGGHSELAVGPSIGMMQFGYVQPNFTYLDPNDVNIPISGGNDNGLDIGFGLWFKRQSMGPLDDFYAGFSATHLNEQQFQTQLATAGGATSLNRDFDRHYYLLFGGDYDMGSLVLEPAILFKAAESVIAKPQFDMNATVLWNQQFRGGLGYRQWGTIDALTVMLGYERGALQIGYSYDITTSRIQQVSNGTHEVFLAYCLPIKVTTETPKNIRLTPRFL